MPPIGTIERNNRYFVNLDFKQYTRRLGFRHIIRLGVWVEGWFGKVGYEMRMISMSATLSVVHSQTTWSVLNGA